MLSQSTINQLLDYDVVFVGNIGAVAASSFARKHRDRFKIGLMHLEECISEPSLLPLNSSVIRVTGMPEVEMIHQRVVRMRPEQRVLELQGGKRLGYKILVYAEWQKPNPDHVFYEALSSRYSRVESNFNHTDIQLQVKDGNFVFIVQNRPNSFSQCYPFLHFYYKMNQLRVSFKILLEGDTFFPHCPFAHQLLQQNLRTHRFKIVYKAKVIKVDYLRRVIHFSVDNGLRQMIDYEGAYCLLGQTAPQILKKSGIQARNCHPKYLYNRQHPGLYVLGADSIPTTHSFTALSHQIKTLIENLPLQISHEETPSQTLRLSPYQGHTRIKLILSDKETVTLRHNYTPHEYDLQKTCGFLTRIYQQYVQPHIIKEFYNFGAYGMGCFLWTFETPTAEEVMSQISQEKQLEGNNIFSPSESQSSYYH